MPVKHELETQKMKFNDWKVRCGYLRMLVTESVSVSRSSSVVERWLWPLLIRRSKLKNFPTKWQSPTQIRRVQQQDQSFVANWTDRTLSSHYSLWLLDILHDYLSLGSTALFGRPSASVNIPSFSHSAALSLLHLCLTLSKTQNQEAFSLHAGALSLWHLPPQ